MQFCVDTFDSLFFFVLKLFLKLTNGDTAVAIADIFITFYTVSLRLIGELTFDSLEIGFVFFLFFFDFDSPETFDSPKALRLRINYLFM